MNTIPKLTSNGILYLSLGFKQNYYFQILTVSIGENKELQIVLYDGVAYIGAIYRREKMGVERRGRESKALSEQQNFPQTSSQPKQLDIVRIYPLTIIQNQPILIDQLEIVYSGLTSLLGKEVISLSEFMRRREFSRKYIQIDQQQSEIYHSRKITKINDQQKSNQTSKNSHHLEQVNMNVSQIHFQSNTHKPNQQRPTQLLLQQRQTQKIMIQSQQYLQRGASTLSIIQKEATQSQPIIVSNIKQQNQEILLQMNQDKQEQKQILPIQISQQIVQDKVAKSAIIQIDIDNTNLPSSKPLKNSKTSPISMYIHDLYERMHRFRILCRINYLSHFTSKKGSQCTKLVLIDELGSQIVCMLYQKPQQKESGNTVKLVKGRSYIFQNGEVVQDKNGISINIPWSGIIEQHKFIPSFVPSKMHRLGQIQKQASFFIQKAINLQKQKQTTKKPQQINICGIFKGFKVQPKLIHNLFRVHGMICDPDQQLLIHFYLLVDELSSFPAQGDVISLHNVLVIEDGERTLHIQNTKKSYVLSQTGNTHQYFADLLKSSIAKTWNFHEYRDLSQIAYVGRTISELKVMLTRMLEHELAYSQIDCNIVNITEKKFYNACVTCKRQTKPQIGIFTFCYSCRQLVKYSKRFLFDLQVSDPTGSLVCSLSSDQLLGFINLSGEEYGKYQKEDRLCYLQLSAYQNIVMKVKSQRVVGGVNHRAVSGGKVNYQRGLAQIKSIVIDQKTKYNNTW